MAESLEVRAFSPAVVESMSSRAIVARAMEDAVQLARKEVELARAEMRENLRTELATAKRLGIGLVCALCTINLLLVAGALALGLVIAEWGAALIVAGAVLMVGAIFAWIGWSRRVTSPMESTRRSLKEDALWAKERLA
jgi:hypothetical protein